MTKYLFFRHGNNNIRLDLLKLDKYYFLAPFTWRFELDGELVKESTIIDDVEKTPNFVSYLIYVFVFIAINLTKKIDVTLFQLDSNTSIIITVILYIMSHYIFSLIYFIKLKNSYTKGENVYKTIHFKFVPNKQYYLYCLGYVIFVGISIIAIYMFLRIITIIHSIVLACLMWMLYELQHYHWMQYIKYECEINIIDNESE